MKLPKKIIFSLLMFANLCNVQNSLAQGFGQVPASTESPVGMQVINSEDDAPPTLSIQQVVYAEREEADLRLYVISPPGLGGFGPPAANSAEARPLVVYVQGSAWFAQDSAGTLTRMMPFVAETGYVVASVQYRPSTVASAPAQLEDVLSAIRYMKANAQRFHIDPERVAVWGDSSGGHMAAMVGTAGELDQFVTADNADTSNRVTAVVDFYGPTDFRKMQDAPSAMNHNAANSPESTVIGGPIQDPANHDRVAAYNPITYISPDQDLPPFLIMHGDEDPLVPFNQSVLLFNALTEAGQDVSFYKVAGGGHGTRFWTPAVLDVVKKFLAQQL